MAKSEYLANEFLARSTPAAAAKVAAQDAHGASAYDRTGRNALAYRPSLYNARTAQRGAFSRIACAILNALF